MTQDDRAMRTMLATVLAVWSCIVGVAWVFWYGPMALTIKEVCAIVNGEVTEEQRQEWPYSWKRGSLFDTLMCIQMRDHPENLRAVLADLEAMP